MNLEKINWIIEPSGNCIKYLGEEMLQVAIIQRAIINLSGMDVFFKIAKNKLINNNKSILEIDRLIEEQKFLEKNSKRLISSSYNSINSHALVSLWSAIEVAIEDTIILIFRYGENSLYDLKKSGYSIKNFDPEKLLSEFDARKFYRSFEGQVGKSVNGGVGSVYVHMFEVFNMNISLNTADKLMLSEINAIRNCIMHRGGVLDEKAQSQIISKRHQLNKIIVINNKLYSEYTKVINDFSVSLLDAVVKSKYIKVNY